MTAAQPLPAPSEKAQVVEAMFDRVAPRYDLVNRVITLRMDRRWRRETVKSLRLAGGSRVLDLACGTGDLCREIQRSGMAAIGIDLSAGMLRSARTTAPLARADALGLPVGNGTVDGIVCGFALRNVVSLEEFFSECARVLRPGGRVAILEVAEPKNSVLKAGHALWFRKVVPLIGAVLSDRDAYRYLPASTAYLPDDPVLRSMMKAAGFTGIERRVFALGAAQLLVATRAGNEAALDTSTSAAGQ